LERLMPVFGAPTNLPMNCAAIPLGDMAHRLFMGTSVVVKRVLLATTSRFVDQAIRAAQSKSP
jgi:hypothetical protein